MIICDYYKKLNNDRLVVGLGYFDSVHKGHAYLISEVIKLANKLNAKPAIFTFVGNPFKHFGGDTLSIFPFEERVRRLENEGVEVIIGANAEDDFFRMSGEEFLDIMNTNYNIVGYVSGTDYTYGAKAGSNVSDLVAYASRHNIETKIVDLVEISGHKIASRDIRTLLLDGDIAGANELLSEPYSISGTIKAGRRDGGKIGFPTANIDLDEDILRVKRGVYSTIVIVNGKRYRAVTNVGAHPTFGDNRENIEAYILDFDEQVYGEEMTVIFVRWLRGVFKFASVKELQETIARDEITTRREVDL